MSAGREDLARAALERKQLIVQEASSLDQQVAELESQQQQLTDAERALQIKIEELRTNKEVIKARYSASEAQVQISEAATGIGDHMADLGEAIQRAIDKTDQMQARASAVEELQAAGTFDDLTSLGSERRCSLPAGAGRSERDRLSSRVVPSSTVIACARSLRGCSGVDSQHESCWSSCVWPGRRAAWRLGSRWPRRLRVFPISRSSRISSSVRR
jgi:hypothetical protein